MQNYLLEPVLKIVVLQTLEIQKDSFINEDLQEVFSDEEIKGEARLRILLSVFRDIFKNNNDELLKVVYNATLALDELEDQETGIEYFETFMRYVFNAGPQLTKNELEKIMIIDEIWDCDSLVTIEKYFI